MKSSVLTGKLREFIYGATADRLPSLQSLAQRWGVTQYGIRKALLGLRQEGLVEFSRGSSIRISGVRSEGAKGGGARTVNAFDTIYSRIAQGHYRAGHALPPVIHMARELNAPVEDVRSAFDELARQKLVSRQGRRWILGKPPASGNNGRRSEGPVIVIVQPRPGYWHSLGKSERVQAFHTAFSTEAEKFGYDVTPVFLSELQGAKECNNDAIKTVLKECGKAGHRWAGTLLVGRRMEIPHFMELCSALAASAKPVVWFDDQDDPAKALAGKTFFLRAHFSEECALREALVFLHRKGCRKAAYVNLFDDAGWARRRGARLKEIAAGLKPPFEIRVIPPVTSILDSIGPEEWRTQISHYLSKQAPVARHFQLLLDHASDNAGLALPEKRNAQIKMLIKRIAEKGKRHYGNIDAAAVHSTLAFPLILRLLHFNGPVAIIAANDFNAHALYEGILSLNIAFPKQWSILSFDNYSRRHSLPFPSVDFGFGSLGYAAFHAIANDIPIQHDGDGNIAPMPGIVSSQSAHESMMNYF
jgi:DNA-binding transcriptional regulator YhcF (GntR family)